MNFAAVAKALCGCIALLAPGLQAGLAQDQPAVASSGFLFRSWQTENGLPQNTVRAMARTRDGYLWLATESGLARFDGVRFRTYRLADGLTSVACSALVEDREGRLWVGTSAGISRMSGGRLGPFLTEGALFQAKITGLAEDQDGNMWIASDRGLYCWRQGQLEQRAEFSGEVEAVAADRQGGVWVLGAGRLWQLSGRVFTVASLPPRYATSRGYYSLLADRQNRLWLSIGFGVVLCRENGQWTAYDRQAGLPATFIYCFAEDAAGTIWAGSFNSGLYRFGAGRFEAFRQSQGLSDDFVRCVLGDGEGNLWVGTLAGGLNRMSPKRLEVVGEAAGLLHRRVRSVAEAADGSLWLCTHGGGLYRWREGQCLQWGQTNQSFRSQSFGVGLLTTPDDMLWWNVESRLLGIKNGNLVQSVNPTNWPATQGRGIRAFCADSQGGLWLSTIRSGLHHWQQGALNSLTNQLGSVDFLCAVQAPDGTLWAGTAADGLFQFKDGAVSSYGKREGLRSAWIQTLCLDRAGTLWIGTAGGGLSRLKDGRISSFDTRCGLLDDTVGQILEDNLGYLWLGCDRGLARLDKRELEEVAAGHSRFVRPLIFGKADGMAGEDFLGDAFPNAVKTRGGRLCFPTSGGLVIVDPTNLVFNPKPPKVLIEGLEIDGQWHGREEGQSAAKGATTGLVRIPPGKSLVDIEYTAFSFSAPEQVRFRYWLEGVDPGWVNAGSRRQVSYMRLRPGQYTFHVMACNHNGIWNEAGDRLAIEVLPHYWETGWFRGGCLALFGMTLTLGTRFVARRKYLRRLERLEQLNAMERERARIARDIHDDIGASLTQITLLGEMGRGDAADQAKAEQHFERITAKARTMVQTLEEIVWAVNPKNDNLPRFAEYISRLADECFEPTRLLCHNEVPEELPALALSAEVRHNLFLSVKEALNNIVKHAQASQVWLRLALAEQQLRIEIEDDGCGFDLKDSRAGGNGLRNMRLRLKEIGGECQCDSAPGKGTRLRFGLPTDKLWGPHMNML